jgi:hypothetical protein
VLVLPWGVFGSEGAGKAGERGGREAGRSKGAGTRGYGREAEQDRHARCRVRHAEAGEGEKLFNQ